MTANRFRAVLGCVLGVALLSASGCDDWQFSAGEETATGGSAGPAEPAGGEAGAVSGATSGGGGFPAEIDTAVRWLHTDVSTWPQTASLNASIGGGTINMPYSKAKVWPASGGVNANCWVFARWSDGQWYAATFEYLRSGQTAKPMGVLSGAMGDHIKVSPLSQWRPRSGERIGLMVSGLARSSSRNVRERSNVVMVTWP